MLIEVVIKSACGSFFYFSLETIIQSYIKFCF